LGTPTDSTRPETALTKIRHPAIDLQIYFVNTPNRVSSGGDCAVALQSSVQNDSLSGARFRRRPRSALGQQILDVAKTEGEPEIEPDRLINDLKRESISGLVASFNQFEMI